MKKLNDSVIKNAKATSKPYKLADGGGLYLLVGTKGSKLWRYKYRLFGKEGSFSIGSYPEVGLARAREIHLQSRALVARGIPPLQHKRVESLRSKLDAQTTFEVVARQWIEANAKQWVASNLRQVTRVLETDVFPEIGSIPLKAVSPAQVLRLMQRAESRSAPTIATLIRQYCSAVYRFAIPRLLADSDPASALKGAVIRPKVRHNPPLAPKEIPPFLVALSDFGGYRTTCIAIELLLLTFVRTVELRKAKWVEIDFENCMWRVPADRMKMRVEHLVPLAPQSVALLRELYAWTGNRELLFPNYRNPKDCMTATTVNRALERMGYQGKFSAHGFRSTASTILHEQGNRPEVIERQLAHAERNGVKAAYNQAQYMQERVQMMRAWATYIDTLRPGANIVILKLAS